jgi:hypothetical protein
MKLQKQWFSADIFSALEKLGHGEKLAKFITKDEGAGDMSVELHGLVDERGTLYIFSQKFSEREKSKRD